MLNSLFIVWRESIEAMLVIGVLYAWLKRNDHSGSDMRALWIGVGAGLGLAVALGWAILAVQNELAGEALEWFQTAMLFIAAALIVQMVWWMQKHGREMKQSLEREVTRAAARFGMIGIAAIAALAIAREGAETVIFLYGMQLEEQHGVVVAIGAGAGMILAALTAWTVNRGLRYLDYRQFFRVSGFLLLLFAVALLATGTDRMIGMGWLPPMIDPFWDTSTLIEDGSTSGILLSAFTGYRARPSLMLVAVYVAY
ncbi:MAG: FTR1 family iron permease [Burkholderiales bacterium RIFCSPLOWO2_02_FULL_57_36]|nr:MAG: FTR1 family iron permease [Burkholderiales bacterium RIFCSPLOWO2_02_FULL_57_36]